MVARGKADEKILSELMEKGKTNGVQGLKIIDQTEVGYLMVNVQCACVTTANQLLLIGGAILFSPPSLV